MCSENRDRWLSKSCSIGGQGIGAMLRAMLRGSFEASPNLWVIGPGTSRRFWKILTTSSGR